MRGYGFSVWLLPHNRKRIIDALSERGINIIHIPHITVKTNFKTTTPTLLRKKKSESSTSTCVWGNTTKTFLEVTKNNCYEQVKPKQEIEVFQEAVGQYITIIFFSADLLFKK